MRSGDVRFLDLKDAIVAAFSAYGGGAGRILLNRKVHPDLIFSGIRHYFMMLSPYV